MTYHGRARGPLTVPGIPKSFQDLYDFSVSRRSEFYEILFSWANIIHRGSCSAVVDKEAPIDAVPRWFPGVCVNWAENILFARGALDTTDYQGTVGKEDNKIAVTEIHEGNTQGRHLTWAELRHHAGRFAAALKTRGVKQGDRIVLIGANSIHTLLIFIATTWLGAIFSSSSTEMGVKGILQRAVQVDPKFVFFDDAAVYNGKTIDLRPKMVKVLEGVRACTSFSGLVSVPRFVQPYDVEALQHVEPLASFLASAAATPSPPFSHIPFHDPFLICYSSGTTGAPKAIVHTVGGALLNLAKEGRLHESTSASSVTLQYTTTGWIMYLLSTAALLTGARVVLYDGSPFAPDPMILIKIMEEQRVTKLGTSPRWMLEVARRGIRPRQAADLSALRVVTSTGMVLPDRLFEWFYDVGFPPSVHLVNMSGGTDIAGCFGTGNPLTCVYVGGTQGPSLGVPVSIYDGAQSPGRRGNPVPPGTAGELVATAAFPNMPCFFWGDASPHGGGAAAPSAAPPGSKYHSSYFERFDHVWSQGDFCFVHPRTGGIHFLGRADGVLNPGGIRFGSSEIYAVVERNFSHVVADSICVGQRRPDRDADERVMLFLLMRKGQRLTRALVGDVKGAIGRELTKRHVPTYVFETPEIPMTVNLKKVELPVKQIVSGLVVKPSGTLLNPQSLDFYYKFADVEKLVTDREKL
ncbi:Acetoacetyl-CoA synthetase [Zalerion maritima]|uniref:Acetoacetyl-CoA synthetase n=1 Tax=Zalerion maritima TaxID=339359 RepID=A0AAD5RL35_9PEZI|nr:Acetoacetyl-CoA synthetase [Zalerion maritima]